MLLSGLSIVQQAYEQYAAAGVAQLLLISSLIVILIKDKKSENRQLAYYIIALTVLIFIPPTAFILAIYFIGEDVYWRVFWLIPSVIVIAYAGTKLIEQIGKKSRQRLMAAAMIIVVVLGGRCVYNSENFTKSTNLYKLPQEALDLCEMVAPNGGTTKIIVPETIVSYIRQYNANINMLYGRNLGKDTKRGKNYTLLLQLNSLDPDIPYIAEYAKTKKCEYVVFENTSNGIEQMTNEGFELYGNTKNYTVFKSID
ncbi:hypothetical protein C8E03_10331 [Lachnotalea glycerini]|uniref:Uncharacterized protein n=1 Tax=Lachnotalea glycerini TaxID=1763509 RepID=A0A318EN10_9FIRM|nr:hypothetical protein [Lachnotalea glycerini]PXV91475.1 hypothetical protein C8E03_10331 [Lachnotalea glycerini]